MSQATARRGAIIALALLSVIWGFNWIVMKSVLVYVGPLTFSAMRYVFGTAVLFLVLVLRRESLAPTPWRDTLLIGLTQTTGFQLLVQIALLTGGAGKTALLAYTMPFWVIPLAWLVLGDRPALRQWLFIGIAALGLVLVLEPWRGVGSALSALLALAGGMCWAISTVLSKRLFHKATISPLRLTAWQMLYGTIVLVAIASCLHERSTQWSPILIGALVYNGVLSSGLAWAMWLFVVQRLPASVAGLASLITPLVGVAFAWVLLGERPDTAESAGIALMFVALFGVLRPVRRV
jgi:drug/metabolite transporter (DMT)-like permease